jgi:alkaline phosphatase D
MDFQRRYFLHKAGSLAALAAAGGTLMGMAATTRNPSARYPFSIGVASGAPLPNGVMLWTRIVYDPLNAALVPPVAISLRWEVAHDESFRRIAASGTATALPELAHSVHVDVPGLAPSRWYYYRFMLGDAVSPVGRTRTAPAPNDMPDHFKLAVASCQHWEFGTYVAHKHIASAAPDLVAFLGDYIYEWGAYQLKHPNEAERINESFSLDEYRARYAQYKSDPHLQLSHHAAPWVVTWDDHEVANDYGGDRDERLAADFPLRRAAAYQAFYEHMPVRILPPPNGYGSLRMYQRYDWGRLARIYMLDDRQYRSIHACMPADVGGSGSVTRKNCADLTDPSRTLLGHAQERWLTDSLVGSRARWNIIGQQTLMAQSSQVLIKEPTDGRFWNDGWDGYPQARARLFEALRASNASNPVILAGDVHSFYATELRPNFDIPVSADNPVIATEFCGTSVTSSSRPQARTLAHIANNPHMKYGRSDKRGFTLLDVTPKGTTTMFMGLDDVRNADSGVERLASFYVTDGRPGVNPAA